MNGDPELAYRHAQVALARGGRVDVVREAAALTAYATGRYAEALREFRTLRRLAGTTVFLPQMADCERGLGRPERAIALAKEAEDLELDVLTRVELDIVTAGARHDLGQSEVALLALSRLHTTDDDVNARIAQAQIPMLRALGRDDEADALQARGDAASAVPEPEPEEDIVLYDVAELPIADDEGTS